MKFMIVTCLAVLSYISIISCSDIIDSSSKLSEIIATGLNEVNRKTTQLRQSLQENVVETINEGREKIFLLKMDIQKKIQKVEISPECIIPMNLELKKFEKKTRIQLNICSGNSFQNSEEYRRDIKLSIDEIESGIVIRRNFNSCIGIENVDNDKCAEDEVNEYNIIAKEFKGHLKEVVEMSREYTIQVLNELMECNKDVLNKARKMREKFIKMILKCIF